MKRFALCVLGFTCLTFITAGAFSQAPPSPTNLTAKVLHAFGDDREGMAQAVVLSWQFSSPVSMSRAAFRIYRSVDDSAAYKQLSVAGDHSYADRDVFVGHTYYYQVTAVFVSHDSASAESGRSNTAWVKILPPPGHVTGQISGTVVDSVTGNPIAGVRIRFFRNAHEFDDGAQTWSDSLGRYSALLDTGKYLILAQPHFWSDMMMHPVAPPYRAKWYKNAYEPSGAAPVTVVEGGNFTADFALVHFVIPVRVHVRGTVRDSAGNVLRGAVVLFMRTVQQMEQMAEMDDDAVNSPGEARDLDDLGRIHGVLWGGATDSTGAFDASVLSGNSYIALAEKKGFVPQFFDHKSQPADATILIITGDTSGINFNLNPVHPPQTYALSGAVRDSAGVRVPSRIILFPLRPHPEHAVRFASTDSLGLYTVQKIPAGKYIVLALPYGKYAPAFYKAGAFGVMHWKDADTVTVTLNVTGIDIGVVAVRSGGFAWLRGRVESGGRGASGISVFGEAPGGSLTGYALTDNAGAYEISGLPPGVMTIVVDGEGYNEVQQQLVIGPADYALTKDFSISVATISPGSAGGEKVPGNFRLGQNYPNPFNPSTTITFSLPVASTVTIRVFNLLGQEITSLASGVFGPGSHSAVWDGHNAAGRVMASGVYFYRMEAAGVAGGESYREMKRMLLLR
jgi:hypothetical protein